RAAPIRTPTWTRRTTRSASPSARRTTAGGRCSGPSRCSRSSASTPCSEGSPGSALQPHRPHVVAFADRYALHAQDVVRRRGVEVEVRQRERQEESLGRERHLEVAYLEDDVLAFEPVHLGGLHLLQLLQRVGDELLQPAIVVGRRLRRRLEQPVL